MGILVSTLKMVAGENRIFDINLFGLDGQGLRKGDTLDTSFTPTVTVAPAEGLVISDTVAIAPNDIRNYLIRARYVASATGEYLVTFTYRTMQEPAVIVRIGILVS